MVVLICSLCRSHQKFIHPVGGTLPQKLVTGLPFTAKARPPVQWASAAFKLCRTTDRFRHGEQSRLAAVARVHLRARPIAPIRVGLRTRSYARLEPVEDWQ